MGWCLSITINDNCVRGVHAILLKGKNIESTKKTRLFIVESSLVSLICKHYITKSTYINTMKNIFRLHWATPLTQLPRESCLNNFSTGAKG